MESERCKREKSKPNIYQNVHQKQQQQKRQQNKKQAIEIGKSRNIQ